MGGPGGKSSRWLRMRVTVMSEAWIWTRCGMPALVPVLAAPGRGRDADRAGEDAGQVGLIRKTAVAGDLGHRAAGVQEHQLGVLNAVFKQPAVRRRTHRLAEGLDEIAARQSAGKGHVADRHVGQQVRRERRIGGAWRVQGGQQRIAQAGQHRVGLPGQARQVPDVRQPQVFRQPFQ
ncbi:hypothetical protein G6F65_020148 [Rhizopus arrhizus]|nr:hypothetical protein G6F65_020148 [Rhizopus arrhizus]